MEQIALWEDDTPKAQAGTRSKNVNYEDFVEKFKPKKTTDDCYTPPIIFNAISEWVAHRYELDPRNFVRPFYPGGDYIAFEYSENSVVVDNPPFSILAQIAEYYQAKKIKYFLYAPTLTLFSKKALTHTCLPIGADIIYENGAQVCTSFITNLEPPEIMVRTYPELYKIIKQANDENQRQLKRSLPKYSYPDYILTAAMAYRYSQFGVDYVLYRDQCRQIDALDAQRDVKKAIFGKGLLLSERAAAERAAAERAAATRWKLSEGEKEAVRKLSEKRFYYIISTTTGG